MFGHYQQNKWLLIDFYKLIFYSANNYDNVISRVLNFRKQINKGL